MPKRIQRKRTKGWKMPEGVVSVCRPGKWGNPFVVGKPIPKVWLHMEFDRADTKKYLGNVSVPDAVEAVRLFEKYSVPDPGSEFYPVVMDALKGKDLACWCPLDQPCHADVLLRLANQS